MRDTDEDEEWLTVKKCKNSISVKQKTTTNNKHRHSPSYYHQLSHLYATLPEFAADPPQQSNPHNNNFITQQQATPPLPIPSTYKHKARRKFLECQHKREQKATDAKLIDHHIQWAEDERTALEKLNQSKPQLAANAVDHTTHQPVSILQNGRNTSYALATTLRRAFQRFKPTRHVHFDHAHDVKYYDPLDETPLITYDSGADGHYITEQDRSDAGLPILCKSSKRVGVAKGGTSTADNVTTLPFQQLSEQARQADTFSDFPQSLMSVGKVSDDGTVSIFTQDGVTVHKEEDVLITCKGQPILIGVRDEHGRYRIPLTQHKGQWQPRQPTKRARIALHQANSVYDLPNTEQAIKWMHAVCGYPVKSTWIKAIKAGNFMGWPLLTEQNVRKYYPETTETPKGHLNQSRKNVRSTKPKPLEDVNSTQLRGRKVQDIYTKVYNVRDTVFTDQTGHFPWGSQAGHKYIMVMVDIDSNAILVEPLKNRKDGELIRGYEQLLARLTRAGIKPKKHVLDNEVSATMKDIITNKYQMTYELVPPGCHRHNAAEVAIRNFKAHFLSVLAGVSSDFPLSLWDKLLPQTEITLNLRRQSNATPTVSAYAHLNGPFDYNKMPLAPMGCNVQVHEKADSVAPGLFIPLMVGTSTPLQNTTAPIVATSRTPKATASATPLSFNTNT